MTKTKYIVVLLLFVSIFQVHAIPNSQNQLQVSKNPNKFILFKIDDIGNNVSFTVWKSFFDLVMNNNYTVDLGIIGHYQNTNLSSSMLDYLHKLLNTGNVYLYNHGWEHRLNEFTDDRSYDYINTHLHNWDLYMQINELYRLPWIRVLGAPGNAFGHEINSSVYSAMEANNYSALYFSKQDGNTSDGPAGLNLEYISAESISHGVLTIKDVDTVIDEINNSPARAVFIQLHPSHPDWNIKDLKNLFDRVYNETDRTPINIDNYYRNYFIKDHPNYFLKNDFGYVIPPIDTTSALSAINSVDTQTTTRILTDRTFIIFGVVALIPILLLSNKRRIYVKYLSSK